MTVLAFAADALGNTTTVSAVSPLPTIAGAGSVGAAGYVNGATAVMGTSGNVANAAAVATLAGAVGKTTYITAIYCNASGSTAGLVVSPTITGLIGGTLTFTFVFPVGVLVSGTPLRIEFIPPLPASGLNTAIVCTLPAGGAGTTNATVNATGFQV